MTIHAVEEYDGVQLLVMDLIEGMTLDELLSRRGKLTGKEVARLGAQIAAGLAAAHERGLTHRDIKPANILLEVDEKALRRGDSTENMRVKITDFGLARTAAESSLTNPGSIVGTPQSWHD